MIRFRDTKTETNPQIGDFLLYEIESSLIEYHRTGCYAGMYWNNNDNKHIIPPLANADALVAIGEVIGAIFGFSARMDNSTIDANPNMRGRYWRVVFF